MTKAKLPLILRNAPMFGPEYRPQIKNIDRLRMVSGLPDQYCPPLASVFKMRDVTRHKSMDVLQAYVRDADLFREHAGAGYSDG
jgi:hypothetical protein